MQLCGFYRFDCLGSRGISHGLNRRRGGGYFHWPADRQRNNNKSENSDGQADF